ncbi:hypothetical protein DFJ58DRAFT_735118 [Suillus subalutaceus]|nr:uncharacterized protein DFJ58DRAFT_735118 [Suillus subalutaceus]KAG1836253.1 hypothetical protein DFJ58DRAFT_735118 [Suillus subalutaceus]
MHATLGLWRMVSRLYGRSLSMIVAIFLSLGHAGSFFHSTWLTGGFSPLWAFTFDDRGHLLLPCSIPTMHATLGLWRMVSRLYGRSLSMIVAIFLSLGHAGSFFHSTWLTGGFSPLWAFTFDDRGHLPLPCSTPTMHATLGLWRMVSRLYGRSLSMIVAIFLSLGHAGSFFHSTWLTGSLSPLWVFTIDYCGHISSSSHPPYILS